MTDTNLIQAALGVIAVSSFVAAWRIQGIAYDLKAIRKRLDAAALEEEFPR